MRLTARCARAAMLNVLLGAAVAAADPIEIHITGALSPMGLEQIGRPAGVTPKEELRNRPEPTIGEILAAEPGISTSYYGPGSGRPIVRGQSKQRLRVLENGLESGDLSDISDDHAMGIDPLGVQRADVLRGPDGLLYGSSVIGGAVNIVDDAIAESPIGRVLRGELNLLQGDSAGGDSSGSMALGGEAGVVNWHLSGFLRETDEIEIPGFAESKRLREREASDESHTRDQHHHDIRGTLQNSDTSSKGFRAGASHIWNSGYVGLAFRAFDSEYGIPGGHSHHENEVEAEEAERLPRIDLQQRRVESRGEIRLGEGFFRAVRFGAAYSDYRHAELEGGTLSTTFEKDSLENRVELIRSEHGEVEGAWGLQTRYEKFSSEGEEAYLPPSETLIPALFAVENYRITDRLIWEAGARYEFTSVDAESGAEFHALSAATGPRLSLDEGGMYTVEASLSFSERAPAAAELFANGPHLSAQSFEIGDPDLGKERSIGAELGLSKNSGRLTARASVFRQHYFEYINLTPTGDERDALPVFAYEMDRARLWGFETEAVLHLLQPSEHSLELQAQVDYVRGDDLSDGGPLPRITPLRGRLGLEYRGRGAGAYVESVFVDSQNRTAAFELPTDGYSLLNAGASFEFRRADGAVYELFARGTNLTDEDARVHTSLLKDVAPLRGRALFAGLRLLF